MSSRRQFLKTSIASLCTVAVSTSLTGCMHSQLADTLDNVQFNHGVASGDPLSNAVIIWTRVTTAVASANVAWQLATDKAFKNIIRSGVERAEKSRDHTIKIDVQQLSANTTYYYRFLGHSSTLSPIGRTKTLPQGDIEQIKMVVVSCSNYPAGYFNAYDDAAKQSQLDVVVHLGDYIYEYGMGGYATENAEKINRQLANDNQGELLTLNDYRKRYATYRTDKGLQALHAAAPFIAVWDDHEIANDTYINGAQNHNSAEQGDFFLRRAAAIQAYYEWLPIRVPMGEQNPQIYRTFDFGNLLSLHMLDTRIIARDKQLDYGDYQHQQTKQLDVARFFTDLNNPQRQLLGKTQHNWLTTAITQSQSTWQVLGQQILMTKMWLPAEIFSHPDRTKVPAIIKELVAIKQAVLQNNTVNAQQLARVNTLMPYNLDAWDGYPSERESLFQQVSSANKQLVVIAGDTHNAWHGTLKDEQGNTVGVEFATPSVSSPGMEKYLALDEQQAQQMAGALSLIIDDLNYCNLLSRGYMTLTFTKQQITTDWRFIDNVNSPKYTIAQQHQTIYKNEQQTNKA